MAEKKGIIKRIEEFQNTYEKLDNKIAEYQGLYNDIKKEQHRLDALKREIKKEKEELFEKQDAINSVLLEVNTAIDRTVKEKNELELLRDAINQNNKDKTLLNEKTDADIRSCLFLLKKIEAELSKIASFEEVSVFESFEVIENLLASFGTEQYSYFCGLDECVSKDENVKLIINEYTNTLELCFENFFDSFYYKEELEALNWVPDRNNSLWSNHLNDANHKYAEKLIYDYDIYQPAIIEVEYLTSEDGKISAFEIEDCFLCLLLNTDIFREYREELEYEGWTYDENYECWYNDLTDENLDFVDYFIYRYEYGDNADDENEEEFDYSIHDEDDDYGDFGEIAIPVIDISSDDGSIILNNKDDLITLKLYFKYESLDKYDWDELENNYWDYDSYTQAWYIQYSDDNCSFAIALINEYDDTPVASDDDNNEENTEEQSNGEVDRNWNPQSKLNKMGYNVNQKDDLSDYSRRTILIKAIRNGVYTKGELINLLSWLIRQNRGKANMELAISKWRRDLEFVKKYRPL